MLNKVNWTLAWGICGGLIVILAAITQWRDSLKQKQAADESKVEQQKATAELQKLQQVHMESTEKLTAAYFKIAALQEEALNNITGGKDNAPVLVVGISPKQFSESIGAYYYPVLLSISNSGNFTLRNVKATITDLGIARTMAVLKCYLVGRNIQIRQPRPEEVKNFDIVKEMVKEKGVGDIPKGQSPIIYGGVISPALSKLDFNGIYNYNVDVDWSEGRLQFILNININNSEPTVESSYVILNSKSVGSRKYLSVFVNGVESHL